MFLGKNRDLACLSSYRVSTLRPKIFGIQKSLISRVIIPKRLNNYSKCLTDKVIVLKLCFINKTKMRAQDIELAFVLANIITFDQAGFLRWIPPRLIMIPFLILNPVLFPDSLAPREVG